MAGEPAMEEDELDPAGADAQGRRGRTTKLELEQENERLRTRIDSLERELVEVQTRADAVVAAAQERAYWLDRWHLDLNALMRRPGAPEFRAAIRAMRWFVRRGKNLRRRLRAG